MIGLTPELTAVTVVEHGLLDLTFADGTTGEMSVLERLHGPVFALARTHDGFAQAVLDIESGTVAWPDGADLAPDVLYERVRAAALEHGSAA